MSTVAEFMTQSPVTIGDDQSLARAHEVMQEHKIRHLPVLHGGHLVGIVSLGDLHLIETLGDRDLEKIAVEDAMTPEPYVVTPDAELRDVAGTMADHKYGTAIVARGSKVVGIFTTIDALRALTRS
jgi:acetoin utilization protein AcuB